MSEMSLDVIKSKFFNLSIVFFLVFLFFFKPDLRSSFDSHRLILYSFLATFYLIWHLLRESKKNNFNWFRIDTLFLLGFFIVHFQWPIMFSVSGIEPEKIHRIWSTTYYVNRGVWLSLIFLLSWMLGFSLYRKNNKLFIPQTSFYDFKIRYSSLLITTIFLFILFLTFAGKDFLSGGIYTGDSDNLAGNSIAPYAYILFSISLVILTIFTVLKFKGNYNGSIIKWFFSLDKRYLLLIFSYCLIFFTIGDRGGPLSILVLLLVLIGTYIKPIKFWHFLLLFVFGSLLMTIIGLGRADSNGKGIFSAGYEKLELNSYYAPTEQLAGSIRTLFYALEDVPEKNDYFYGKLWLGSILSPIPFAQSAYLELTDDKDYFLSSSGYITYLVYGTNATSGEGTSFVADIYLNFGVLGCLLGSFLIGIGFQKLNEELKRGKNLKWVLVACIVASLAFYFGRSSFLIVSRNIVWGFILIYFFIYKKQRY